MILSIAHGEPVPKNVWDNVVEILTAYVRIGQEFARAGKPMVGELAIRYRQIELTYNQMADAIWFAKWTPAQRKQWHDIYSTQY